MDLLSTVSFWIAIIFVILTAIYFYLTWNFNYWEKQGIPYAQPCPIMGSLQLFGNRRMEEIDMIRYKQYGRVFGEFEGRNPALVVADPNLLKQILVNDCTSTFLNHRNFEATEKEVCVISKILPNIRDEEWKTVKDVIIPGFSSDKLKEMVDEIEKYIGKVNDCLEKYAKKKESVNIIKYFNIYTFGVTASYVLGIEMDSIENDDVSLFIGQMEKFFIFSNTFNALFYMFPFILKLIPVSLVNHNPIEFFKVKVKEIVKLRKTNKEEKNSILDSFLQAQNDAKGHESLIISRCITLLVAGFETTATALSFIAYVLATKPEIQEKLLSEIDEVMEKIDGKISYSAVEEMQYLDMVICETLRMYPPVGRNHRICAKDNYKLGDATLSKSMVVNFPIYCIHHDEEFYPNPQEFIPERFSRENKAKRHPFTYLPFDAGVRACVGKKFGLMQIKLGLVHLLAKYRIVASPELEIPVRIRLDMKDLRLPESVNVILEMRK